MKNMNVLVLTVLVLLVLVGLDFLTPSQFYSSSVFPTLSD